jgi:hypothetical protein
MAVMPGVRFLLPIRNVENLMQAHHSDISDESRAAGQTRLCPMCAVEIRKSRAEGLGSGSQWRWNLDVRFVSVLNHSCRERQFSSRQNSNLNGSAALAEWRLFGAAQGFFDPCRNRHDRLPLRSGLAFPVGDQPYRAVTHFWGNPVRRLARDFPSCPRAGASGKPDAVQRAARLQPSLIRFTAHHCSLRCRRVGSTICRPLLGW